MRGKEFPQKKVLSLVLCVAVMLSVMVMGAGAAFSDQSKIKNTEAVDACTALNIIGGYPDGSFKPEGNITRAEVTKMICVALNGGKNPAVSTNTTPTFSDVRNNANAAWAEGYIESCAAQGIVSGVGGGKFAPNGNVTGVQLAKMLLVSLGYKSENEGFTGNAWATNVNVRAAQKGLYAGLESMDTNAAISRDNAAQMVWNAMNAYEVEYKTTLTTDKNGQLTSQITVQDKVVGSTNDKITLLEDKYETDSPTGILTSVKQESGKDTYKITISDATYNGKTYNGGSVSYSKVSANYVDLLGQDVRVLVKPSKNGKDAVVYGVYSTTKNTVVTAYADDLDNINKTAGKLEINDVSYKTDTANASNLPVYTAPDMTRFVVNQSNVTIQDLKDKFPYYSVKFVDNNDDDKLDCAIVTPVIAAQIDSLNASNVTLSAIDLDSDYTQLALSDTSPDRDDVDLYKDAAEDDYVAVVDADYSVSGDMTITKLDSVSGKVDATRASGSEFKTNSNWYTIVADDASVSLNDEYDFATIGSFVFAVDATSTSVSASNILFVDDAAKTTSGVNKGVEATVYFADGTSSTVKLTKLDGTKFYDNGEFNDEIGTEDAVEGLIGNIYKFTKKSATEYEIKSLDNNKGSYDEYLTADAHAVSSIKDGKIDVTDSNKKDWRMADEGVIFVKTNDETKVLTGKQVKAWSDIDNSAKIGKVSALADKSSGYYYAKVGAINLITKDVPGSSDYLYAYALTKVAEIDQDGTKYQFDAWDGKEVITLTTEDNDNKLTTDDDSLLDKGFFVEYSKNGDLVDIKSVKTIDDAVSISGFDADGINFLDVTSSTYSGDFDDDYVVIGVNTKDVKGVSGAKLATAKAVAGSDTYYQNAVYFLNNDTDKDVIAVFVDTSGKMYDNNGDAQMTASATTISNIALTVAAPAKDATPVSKTSDITTTTNGLTVKGIKWTDAEGDTVSGNFAAGTVYKAEITVGAASGLFKLASNPTTVTVNGKTSGNDNYTITYNGGVVTVTFPATAADDGE